MRARSRPREAVSASARRGGSGWTWATSRIGQRARCSSSRCWPSRPRGPRAPASSARSSTIRASMSSASCSRPPAYRRCAQTLARRARPTARAVSSAALPAAAREDVVSAEPRAAADFRLWDMARLHCRRDAAARADERAGGQAEEAVRGDACLAEQEPRVRRAHARARGAHRPRLQPRPRTLGRSARAHFRCARAIRRCTRCARWRIC